MHRSEIVKKIRDLALAISDEPEGNTMSTDISVHLHSKEARYIDIMTLTSGFALMFGDWPQKVSVFVSLDQLNALFDKISQIVQGYDIAEAGSSATEEMPSVQ